MNKWLAALLALTLALPAWGQVASRDFDGGTDVVTISDTDDLTFGDSSDDSPFSVVGWVYMDDSASFNLLAKDDPWVGRNPPDIGHGRPVSQSTTTRRPLPR